MQKEEKKKEKKKQEKKLKQKCFIQQLEKAKKNAAFPLLVPKTTTKVFLHSMKIQSTSRC